jgi:hypothetical protein
MKTFADDWGPVWAEPVDGIGLMRIRKCYVSKGIIYRSRDRDERLVAGAIHATGITSGSFRRRFSGLLPRHEDMPYFAYDLLLIGTKLRENASCTFNLQDLESKYGDNMTPLGSKPSTWKLDTAVYAFQFAAPEVVTFQIQGKVKNS